MQEHPEEEVERDEDEDDKWWEEGKKEEKEEPKEIKTTKEKTTKEAGTDPWEWRGAAGEKDDINDETTAELAQNVDDFENDDALNRFGRQEEDGDICNFDLDLYSGDF